VSRPGEHWGPKSYLGQRLGIAGLPEEAGPDQTRSRLAGPNRIIELPQGSELFPAEKPRTPAHPGSLENVARGPASHPKRAEGNSSSTGGPGGQKDQNFACCGAFSVTGPRLLKGTSAFVGRDDLVPWGDANVYILTRPAQTGHSKVSAPGTAPDGCAPFDEKGYSWWKKKKKTRRPAGR